MLVLAGSLCLLVELAFQFCRINDRRRKRERPEWLDLDEETASPLNTQASGIGGASAVSAPTPIAAPQQTRPTQASQPSIPNSQSAPNNNASFFDDVL